MFADYRDFAGSLGGSLVYKWVVVLQYRTLHDFVKRSWERKFVVKGIQRNQQTLL